VDCASILARFGVAPDRARFSTDAFATTVKAKNSSSFSGRQAANSSCITHQFCYAASLLMGVTSPITAIAMK
jgi:hypothetical protein